MAETLGQLLKEANEAREAARLAILAEQAAIVAAKLEADNAIVNSFLDKLSNIFYQDIMKGEPVKTFKIPVGDPFGTTYWNKQPIIGARLGNGNPVPESHPFKRNFDAFYTWADSQGLHPKIFPAVDQLGYKDHWLITVEPK